MCGWHHRQAQIERSRIARMQPQPPLLRDIQAIREQLRHHHQACHKAPPDVVTVVRMRLKQAIDAQSHLGPLRRWLDVHIGCATRDRRKQDLIHQRHRINLGRHFRKVQASHHFHSPDRSPCH